MNDPTDFRNAPGMDAAANGLAAASKSFRGFAEEVQRMSKDTLDTTAATMEKLRGAKSIEDVVSIQTGYLQHSFANYAEYTRRFSELMMSLPMEFARQGQAAFHQGAEAVSNATRQAGQQVKDAGDHFSQHQG